jgi:hypothetical protein
MSNPELAELKSLLLSLHAKVDRMSGGSTPQASKPSVEVADDEDLDGKYGDPEIRRDPPRWSGESYAGRRYSETSPEFLDVMASFLDWAASQAEAKNETTNSGQPRAPYLRRDAARARGHRLRMLNAQAAGRQGESTKPAPKPIPRPASANEDAEPTDEEDQFPF